MLAAREEEETNATNEARLKVAFFVFSHGFQWIMTVYKGLFRWRRIAHRKITQIFIKNHVKWNREPILGQLYVTPMDVTGLPVGTDIQWEPRGCVGMRSLHKICLI